MKKYLNKVIHGDCLEVMKKLPDNCIDLVLTDPPYGINMAKNTNIISKDNKKRFGGKILHKSKKWDSKTPSKETFDELCRISKNQIICGGNYFSDKLPTSRGWIYWGKKEHKTQGNNFADGELLWTSFDCNMREFLFGWIGLDYINNRNGDIKQHPTQKPVELMVWCLENYLMKKWDKDRRPIVFDGFAGSGTTGVACKKCGCDYILVEKEADYIEICEKRLAQETLFNS